MRTFSRLFLALGLLAAGGQRPLVAETRLKGPADLVDHVWSLITDVSSRIHSQRKPTRPRVRPQAIPQGGSPLDLSDLSRPTDVEARIHSALEPKDGAIRLTVANGSAHRGDFSLGSAEDRKGDLLVVDGNADVYGSLRGNLVTVDGNVVVHPGGVISGDVLTLGGQVKDQGGEIGGEVRTLQTARRTTRVTEAVVAPLSPFETVLRRGAGVLGVFLTLCALGFGLVMFGRQNLEIVSDTVSHSFGRAFVTGLLGQILLLPTFGMLVVGLILSVAGILLLPFAIAVFAMLTVIAVVGGYLAVAHAMGETYTRRRMALGVVIGSANSYRYLLVGLLGLASVWAAWALFGWVPVAGSIVWGAAFFVSWLLGTAGFGAALLSRAGIKENFAGRFLPPEALTDEYLWATPQFGVPAGRRPGTRTPTRGG
jgi:hypothetical protein